MDAETALQNADAIVAAARLFRATATERMVALAAPGDSTIRRIIAALG